MTPLYWRDGGFARFELLPEEAGRLLRDWLVAIRAASFRIDARPAFLARHIALSGLLYVAPLPLIAPSVEFRYTIWLFEATVVAVALMVVALRESRT